MFTDLVDRKSGFTLVEIIMVIVIIAIMASLAQSSFTKLTERSRQCEATRLLGHIRRALFRYYAEHGVFLDSDSYWNQLDIVPPGNLPRYFSFHLGDSPATTIVDLCYADRKNYQAIYGLYTIGIDLNGDIENTCPY